MKHIAISAAVIAVAGGVFVSSATAHTKGQSWTHKYTHAANKQQKKYANGANNRRAVVVTRARLIMTKLFTKRMHFARCKVRNTKANTFIAGCKVSSRKNFKQSLRKGEVRIWFKSNGKVRAKRILWAIA